MRAALLVLVALLALAAPAQAADLEAPKLNAVAPVDGGTRFYFAHPPAVPGVSVTSFGCEFMYPDSSSVYRCPDTGTATPSFSAISPGAGSKFRIWARAATVEGAKSEWVTLPGLHTPSLNSVAAINGGTRFYFAPPPRLDDLTIRTYGCEYSYAGNSAVYRCPDAGSTSPSSTPVSPGAGSKFRIWARADGIEGAKSDWLELPNPFDPPRLNHVAPADGGTRFYFTRPGTADDLTVRTFGCEFTYASSSAVYRCPDTGVATPSLTTTSPGAGSSFRIWARGDGIEGAKSEWTTLGSPAAPRLERVSAVDGGTRFFFTAPPGIDGLTLRSMGCEFMYPGNSAVYRCPDTDRASSGAFAAVSPGVGSRFRVWARGEGIEGDKSEWAQLESPAAAPAINRAAPSDGGTRLYFTPLTVPGGLTPRSLGCEFSYPASSAVYRCPDAGVTSPAFTAVSPGIGAKIRVWVRADGVEGPKSDWVELGAPAQGGDCSQFVYLYSRGSGSTDAGHIDSIGHALLGALVARFGGRVRIVGLDYAAADVPTLTDLNQAGPFLSSAVNGVGILKGKIASERRRWTDIGCEGMPTFVLAGYSQGAWITSAALNTAMDRRGIAGVALIADPMFDPASRPAAVNSQRLEDGGLAINNAWVLPMVLRPSPGYVPSDVVAVTGSWCRRLDKVCNNSPSSWIHGEHDKYIHPGPEADNAGAFLVSRVIDALPHQDGLFAPTLNKVSPANGGTRFTFARPPHIDGLTVRSFGCEFTYPGSSAVYRCSDTGVVNPSFSAVSPGAGSRFRIWARGDGYEGPKSEWVTISGIAAPQLNTVAAVNAGTRFHFKAPALIDGLTIRSFGCEFTYPGSTAVYRCPDTGAATPSFSAVSPGVGAAFRIWARGDGIEGAKSDWVQLGNPLAAPTLDRVEYADGGTRLYFIRPGLADGLTVRSYGCEFRYPGSTAVFRCPDTGIAIPAFSAVGPGPGATFRIWARADGVEGERSEWVLAGD